MWFQSHSDINLSQNSANRFGDTLHVENRSEPFQLFCFSDTMIFYVEVMFLIL